SVRLTSLEFQPPRASGMFSSRNLIAAIWVLLIGSNTILAQNATQKSAKAESEVATGPLLVKPYLQLGHSQVGRQMTLVWHPTDAGAAWVVDYRPGTGRRWQTAATPTFQRVAVPGVEAHFVYHVALSELESGQAFTYRVSKNNQALFESDARAPKAADQPH